MLSILNVFSKLPLKWSFFIFTNHKKISLLGLWMGNFCLQPSTFCPLIILFPPVWFKFGSTRLVATIIGDGRLDDRFLFYEWRRTKFVCHLDQKRQAPWAFQSQKSLFTWEENFLASLRKGFEGVGAVLSGLNVGGGDGHCNTDSNFFTIQVKIFLWGGGGWMLFHMTTF